MSCNSALPESESIDCVSVCRRSYIRLQSVTVHHVDATVEQLRNVLFKAGIVKNCDPGCWIEVDHDIGIALRTVIPTRASRTKRRAPLRSPASSPRSPADR